jgi:hypothetical protein
MRELTTETKRQVQDLIQLWQQSLMDGHEQIIKGCQALAQAFDLSPEYANSCFNKGTYSERALRRMLDIGRGQRHPRLLTEQTEGETALASCDIALQTRYLDDPIPVVSPAQPSEHRLIRVQEMTHSQVRQVFYRGHIRSLAEQRSVIERQQFTAAPPLERSYVIMKGKVRWLKGCETTAAQLADILKQLVH